MERPALGQEYHQQILLDERKPGQRYHRAGRRSPRHLWRDARLQVLIKCRRTEADILLPSSGIRNNRPLEYGSPWMGKMGAPERSEEHTSELQSLMRISYAVFCLKKKTKEQAR